MKSTLNQAKLCNYATPMLEVTKLAVDDVVRTSNLTGVGSGGGSSEDINGN